MLFSYCPAHSQHPLFFIDTSSPCLICCLFRRPLWREQNPFQIQLSEQKKSQLCLQPLDDSTSSVTQWVSNVSVSCCCLLSLFFVCIFSCKSNLQPTEALKTVAVMSDDPVLSLWMSLFLEHCSAAMTVFCRQDLIYYFIFFAPLRRVGLPVLLCALHAWIDSPRKILWLLHEVHSATDAAARHFQHVGVLTALFQFYSESEQFIKNYLFTGHVHTFTDKQIKQQVSF